jgi:hypothetical protein
VQGVLLAELAVLLLLELLRYFFLVDQRHIVAVLALCALKSDDVRHVSFLQTAKISSGGRVRQPPEI